MACCEQGQRHDVQRPRRRRGWRREGLALPVAGALLKFCMLALQICCSGAEHRPAISPSSDSVSGGGGSRRPMVIMCLVDGSIHALDAESGRLKWSMSSGSSVVSAFTRDEKGDKRGVSGAVEGGSTPSERLEAGKAGGDDAGQEEARIIDVEWDGRDEVVGRDKEPGSNLPARRPEHDSAVAEVKDGKRGAGRGGAADEVETPEIIPSYEKGGGLWLYVDGRLKRVEMSASQIVEASPFIGQDGFIYVGRKKSKLFAVDPESGASTWVHEGGSNPFEDSKCKDPGHDPIIISRSEYTLHARDARTGRQNWNVSIAEFVAHSGANVGVDFDHFAGRSLPAIFVDDAGEVTAFDSATGSLLWRQTMSSAPVCAHMWEMGGAVEVPLHSAEELADSSDGTSMKGGRVAIAMHEGTLFMRPTVSPLYGVRKLIDPSQILLGGRTPTGTALVAGTPSSVLTEESDGTLTSAALVVCVRGSLAYPQCLEGTHKVNWAEGGAGGGDEGLVEAECLEDGGNCPASTLGVGGHGGQTLIGGGLGPPKRRGWRHNVYYIVVGVMMWPAMGLVMWFLAKRGRARRLRRVFGHAIRWAYSKVKKWEDPSGERDTPPSSPEKGSKLKNGRPSKLEQPPTRKSRLLSYQKSPSRESLGGGGAVAGELSWSSSGWSDKDDLSEAGSWNHPTNLRKQWSNASSAGNVPPTEEDLLRQLDAESGRLHQSRSKDDAGLVFGDYSNSGSNNNWNEVDEAPQRKRGVSLDAGNLSKVFQDDDEDVLEDLSSAGAAKSPHHTFLSPGSRPWDAWQTVSRYKKDFEELGRLGKGGFGSVFKVRQRLDDREYAVKKVRLSRGMDERENQRLMREVKIIAQLSSHPNIVRYYGTWIEAGEAGESSVVSGGETGASFSEFTLDSCEEPTVNTMLTSGEAYTWLYIQMELCSRSMRQYMDDKGSIPKIAEIHNQLKEVSEGLRFVHAEGFIHRDIKPDNIFIVGAPPGVAKLGDFGLSCKTSPIQPGLKVPNTVQEVEDGQSGEEEEDDVFNVAEEHTRGVGTSIYTSPELENEGHYDEKVDMYALGIVLFELLQPFNTRMERLHVLQSLRGCMRNPPPAVVARFQQSTGPHVESSLSPGTPQKDPGCVDSDNASSLSATSTATAGGPCSAGSGCGGGDALLELSKAYYDECKLISRLMALCPADRPTAKEVLHTKFLQTSMEDLVKLQQAQIHELQSQVDKIKSGETQWIREQKKRDKGKGQGQGHASHHANTNPSSPAEGQATGSPPWAATRSLQHGEKTPSALIDDLSGNVKGEVAEKGGMDGMKKSQSEPVLSPPGRGASGVGGGGREEGGVDDEDDDGNWSDGSWGQETSNNGSVGRSPGMPKVVDFAKFYGNGGPRDADGSTDDEE